MVSQSGLPRYSQKELVVYSKSHRSINQLEQLLALWAPSGEDNRLMIRKRCYMWELPLRHLPGFTAKFIAKVPTTVRIKCIEELINQVLRQPLNRGEMCFLEGKWFSLQVTDAELQLGFTVDNGRIQCSNQKKYDVQFAAESSDLAQLACKLIDPDTLFFRRKLAIRGDTELGLAIKNLIDDIELTSLPVWAEWPLTQFSRYCERNNQLHISVDN